MGYIFAENCKAKTDMSKEVVISTSALNNQGFRVLTEGIDLEQYKRNPVLLWMHRRPFYNEGVLPLGHVENLRVDGDRLIGTPVFDLDDPFASAIAKKWDAGHLRMVSAGLQAIEESTDASVVVPGQRYATVTRSKLVEVSIVDIGANDDALALYEQRTNHGRELHLVDGLPRAIETPIPIAMETIDTTRIASALGLEREATLAQIEAAVEQQNRELEDIRRREQEHLVEEAIGNGQLKAERKEAMLYLAGLIGTERMRSFIEAVAVPRVSAEQRPSGVINPSSGPEVYRTLADVPAKDLERLRKEQPQEYRRLYEAEYGIELMM